MPLSIILSAPDGRLEGAWRREFASMMDVVISGCSILDVECDALVGPAKSFGFMDGGIDAVYSAHFGWNLQFKLRRRIFDDHDGELLVGAAQLVETGDAGIRTSSLRPPCVYLCGSERKRSARTWQHVPPC
ncbi:hypothetical protein GD416_34640 [Burkholderia sp. BE24]|uniref:hypothetical protein n=1 Tax=unclassified Burkholderia TaxID=2613784 RepID=UPI00117F65F8|nr:MULTISPECIES: hypothetical protein [unclassified Burkholderia]MPV61421.1 hypothetical protein [Burkholderia sp. BE24]